MNDTLQSVSVGIADLGFVKYPGTIKTIGLGSCVGVVLYDENTKDAGLVHVMLPHSNISKTAEFKKGKFADTGIAYLVEELTCMGANPLRLKAKIAGGAQMFQLENGQDRMRIGARNIEAVKEELNKRKIRIVAEDVGGTQGRTIEFFTSNLMLQVRTIQKGVQLL